MKKFKGILTGTLLIMTLGMLTACGNNNNAADETGTVTEENDMMGDNADVVVSGICNYIFYSKTMKACLKTFKRSR